MSVPLDQNTRVVNNKQSQTLSQLHDFYSYNDNSPTWLSLFSLLSFSLSLFLSFSLLSSLFSLSLFLSFSLLSSLFSLLSSLFSLLSSLFSLLSSLFSLLSSLFSLLSSLFSLLSSLFSLLSLLSLSLSLLSSLSSLFSVFSLVGSLLSPPSLISRLSFLLADRFVSSLCSLFCLSDFLEKLCKFNQIQVKLKQNLKTYLAKVGVRFSQKPIPAHEASSINRKT